MYMNIHTEAYIFKICKTKFQKEEIYSCLYATTPNGIQQSHPLLSCLNFSFLKMLLFSSFFYGHLNYIFICVILMPILEWAQCSLQCLKIIYSRLKVISLQVYLN